MGNTQNRCGRRWLVVGLVVALAAPSLGAPPVAAVSADFDDGYIGPDHPEVGYFGVEFRQQDADNQIFSWVGTEGRQGLQDFAACRDVNGDCERLPGEIEFTSILGPCQSATDNYCIVEVASINADGSETVGDFDSYFPDRGWNDFVGDESRGIPDGGPASLWTFPGVSHIGGDRFFVRVGVSGKKVKSKYVLETFQATISPVSPVPQLYCEEDSSGLRKVPWLDALPDDERAAAELRMGSRGTCSPRITYMDEPRDGRLRGRFTLGGGSGTSSQGGSDCVMRGNYQGDGICMNRRAFPGDMRLRLVVRLGEYPKGWLHGRVADPDLTFAALKSPLKGVQISLTGTTVALPVIQAGMQYTDLPKELQVAYKDANKWRGFNGRGGCCAMSRSYGENWQNDPTQFNYHSYPAAWSEHGIDELVAWLPHLGDKATANLSSWSVRTLSEDEMEGADRCLKDETKVVGIVTTNATQYSPGPPKYNSSTATLDYRVAAPHYRSGGEKFFGIYHLIMRSDIARCLYGFSKAPLNASVSVVDDEGVTTVGTRNISEKDGWIKIAAFGFGFSAPTLKVKFGQAKAKTIVCVKGSATRTIVSPKPVCPTGFKKKS